MQSTAGISALFFGCIVYFENYNILLMIVTSNKTPCEIEVLPRQLLLFKNVFYFSKSFCNSVCLLESLCQFQQKALVGFCLAECYISKWILEKVTC